MISTTQQARQPSLPNTAAAVRRCVALCLAIANLIAAPLASSSDNALEFDDLSIQQLTDLKVIAAPDVDRDVNSTPAAIFVLTQDDIRRSGATSLPQALRLVPGLQVAQLDASRWAISVRGFNSRLSMRVLVLLDGRSVYDPVSAGVLWDAKDTMIEEIERIEVIRGPGGTLWGSNAFSGVINIVTKHASQTGGLIVNTEVGSDHEASTAVRLGDADGSHQWRVFAKYLDSPHNEFDDGTEAHDEWKQWRIGGRSDLELDESNQLRVNFEGYSGRADVGYNARAFATGASPGTVAPVLLANDALEGGFVSARWRHEGEDDSSLTIDASGHYHNRDSPLINFYGSLAELNLQHSLSPLGAHRMTWGLGARGSWDTINSDAQWTLSRADFTTLKYSAFVQDEISVFQDRIGLTLGARAENADYEGTDLLPSVRARYSPLQSTLAWIAVSRGLRTPALIERFGRMRGAAYFPPGSAANPMPIPVRVDIIGDTRMQSEKVTAYEFGVRQQFTETLEADLALFYNEYEGMRGPGTVIGVTCAPTGVNAQLNPACALRSSYLVVTTELSNVYDASAMGGEITLTYRPLQNWRLLASYSYLEHRDEVLHSQLGDMGVDVAGLIRGLDPEQQASLRSSYTFNRAWELDAQLRFVDRLPHSSIPSYTDLNLRLAWRPISRFELAFAGSNLLRHRHQEFVSEFADIDPVWVERSVVLQGRWSY